MADATDKTITHVSISVANPSALGLFGLAMVTLVASSQKLGITTGTSFIIPWAFFLGATAQIIASLQDFKLKNPFGAVAFGGYGLFWFSVAMVWMIQHGIFGESMAKSADPRQLAVAYIGYLIFSLALTIAALKINRVIFLIVFLINFLFIGLALNSLGIAKEATHHLAAYAELLISLCGFYGTVAIIINSEFGRAVLPVGVFK